MGEWQAVRHARVAIIAWRAGPDVRIFLLGYVEVPLLASWHALMWTGALRKAMEASLKDGTLLAGIDIRACVFLPTRGLRALLSTARERISHVYNAQRQIASTLKSQMKRHARVNIQAWPLLLVPSVHSTQACLRKPPACQHRRHHVESKEPVVHALANLRPRLVRCAICARERAVQSKRVCKVDLLCANSSDAGRFGDDLGLAGHASPPDCTHVGDCDYNVALINFFDPSVRPGAGACCRAVGALAQV